MKKPKQPFAAPTHSSKQPAVGAELATRKRPWAAAPQGGFDVCHPLFSLEHLDLDGPFGWSTITGDKLREVVGKLREFERRTWAESMRGGKKHFHSIETHKLDKEAQSRLQELSLDDQDCVLSVRLSATERVFAVRLELVFAVIWWDPNHLVCPSELKYT